MSTSNSVFPSYSANNSYYGNTSFEEKNQLGKDAFLKILVTQLKNQDPLEPLKDREFIAQMTQFSSLEQLTNLGKSMTSFIDFQLNNSIAQQSNLLGQKIYWEQLQDGVTTKGEGIVQAISMKNGNLLAELDNGQKVSLATIHRIEKVVEQANDSV
jgi:flagellar basal-body rod modification protein FlgD